MTPSHGEVVVETSPEYKEVSNAGYRAQAQGKNMVSDNPHPSDNWRHWAWRKGFIQAHMDSL